MIETSTSEMKPITTLSMQDWSIWTGREGPDQIQRVSRMATEGLFTAAREQKATTLGPTLETRFRSKGHWHYIQKHH